MIPCRKYLARIGLNIYPNCPIGKCKKEESITHIFFNCKATKPFWDSLGWQNFYKAQDKHWLIQLKAFDYPIKNNFINWISFFPFAIWYIWLNRNNNNQKNTENPINGDHIIERATKFKLLTEKSINTPQKIPIKIRWHKPPKRWFKLNIDASFNSNNQKYGLGGVFRNANGNWVVGFAKSSHASGSIQAEIEALLEGLKTAQAWGMFPLEIWTNSTEVIQSIQQGNRLYDDIVNECKLLMHQHKEITLQHAFRQWNNIAHQMEKKVADITKEKKLFVEPPSYVKSLVESKLEEHYVFVKFLSYDDGNTLASLGNQSVLSDTKYESHVLNDT
ncbi:uncharacterized protein [Nicotiana sylvestris]|uniref:uncharacterized protein n=1 Tax=Nicotiana sylvestris TaxID=4096 RepID=UPI00388C54DB